MSKHLLQQQMIAAQQARLNNAIDTMALVPHYSGPAHRRGAKETKSSEKEPLVLYRAAQFQCWLPSGAKPKTIGETVALLAKTKCLKGNGKEAMAVLNTLIDGLKQGRITPMQIVKILGSAEAQKLSVAKKKEKAAASSPIVRGSAGALSVLKDLVKKRAQAAALANATGSTQAKEAEIQLIKDSAVLQAELAQSAAAADQLAQMEAAMDIVEAEAELEVAAATAQPSAKEDLLAQDDGEMIAMKENQAAAIIEALKNEAMDVQVGGQQQSLLAPVQKPKELFGIPYSTLGTLAVGALIIGLLRRERII